MNLIRALNKIFINDTPAKNSILKVVKKELRVNFNKDPPITYSYAIESLEVLQKTLLSECIQIHKLENGKNAYYINRPELYHLLEDDISKIIDQDNLEDNFFKKSMCCELKNENSALYDTDYCKNDSKK